MKKKFMKILLFSLTCSCLSVHAETTPTEATPAIPEEYQTYLLNREYFIDWVKNVQTGEYPVSFAFADLDQDEYEDLIIRGNKRNNADETLLMFTIDPENNNIVPFSGTIPDNIEAEYHLFSSLPDPENESETIINFDQLYENGNEYAVITAYSPEGDELWTYTTDHYMASQLNQVSKLGIYDDCYYLSESGSVVALDMLNGEILWKNEEFGGSASAVLFEDDRIYLTGYYGPDLFVLSMEGETIHRVGSFHEDMYWPYDLITKDDLLYILYEGGGEDHYGYLAAVNKDGLELTEATALDSYWNYGYNFISMKVVNCNEYITLRAYASDTAPEKERIPLGAYVQYISCTENGFLKVKYSGREGYALADYLAPTE